MPACGWVMPSSAISVGNTSDKIVVSIQSRPRPEKQAQKVRRSEASRSEYQPSLMISSLLHFYRRAWAGAFSRLPAALSALSRHSVQYHIDSPAIRFDYKRMDYRQLRYFIAVAEELSFSRAARRLNISQPPLSVQIKAIETELGTALFSRNRRKVELTPAGELLLENARRAVKQLEHTTDVVRRAGRGEAGTIRLAFTGSVPMREPFAQLLRVFRKRYPDVRIELQHMATGRQFTALANDQIDFGILRPPSALQQNRNIELIPLWHDRLRLFVPAGHPLANSH